MHNSILTSITCIAVRVHDASFQCQNVRYSGVVHNSKKCSVLSEKFRVKYSATSAP